MTVDTSDNSFSENCSRDIERADGEGKSEEESEREESSYIIRVRI